MRVLVTGGAGYIGSHLVDRLLSQGHAVTVVDDLSTGRLAHVEHHLRNDRFAFHQGTILDQALVSQLVSDADMVYHLAATVGVTYIVRDPLASIMTNVHGTENVLRAAAAAGRPVLLASTSEIYGKNPRVPFREDSDRVLGPTSVARWSYSTSKALDEHLLYAYAERGLPGAIVRYFNSYGPGMDPAGYGSVIARFINQALDARALTVHGDGTQTRCFTFVDDTVSGTIAAAERASTAVEAYNIGASRETSILEIAELILNLSGSSSSIEHVPYVDAFGPGFEDSPRRVPDVAKAREALGFQAQVTLEEGLSRTIDWYRRGRACSRV